MIKVERRGGEINALSLDQKLVTLSNVGVFEASGADQYHCNNSIDTLNVISRVEIVKGSKIGRILGI